MDKTRLIRRCRISEYLMLLMSNPNPIPRVNHFRSRLRQGGAAVVSFRRVGVFKSRGGEIPVCHDYQDSIEDIDLEDIERGARRRIPNLGGGRRMGQLCRRPERRGVDGRLRPGVPGRQAEAVAKSLLGPRGCARGRDILASTASVVTVCVCAYV